MPEEASIIGPPPMKDMRIPLGTSESGIFLDNSGYIGGLPAAEMLTVETMEEQMEGTQEGLQTMIPTVMGSVLNYHPEEIHPFMIVLIRIALGGGDGDASGGNLVKQ